VVFYIADNNFYGFVGDKQQNMSFLKVFLKKRSLLIMYNMHRNHEIFTKALKSNRKIILTYHSSAGKLYISKLVIPLYFWSSESKRDTDIYYFWDSQAKGNRMLILKSSQIISMELSDESFAKAD